MATNFYASTDISHENDTCFLDIGDCSAKPCRTGPAGRTPAHPGGAHGPMQTPQDGPACCSPLLSSLERVQIRVTSHLRTTKQHPVLRYA
jgi:hypothetical protein